MGVGGWVFRIESNLMFPIRVNSPARVLEPKCHSYDICGHASRVRFVIGLSNQPNMGPPPPRTNEELTPLPAKLY